MAVRPNFDEVQLDGSLMTVAGSSDPQSDPPLDVHVFIEQAGHLAHKSFDKPNTGWVASIAVKDGEFKVGELALAYGVEMRKGPFLTTTWSQLIEITAPRR
jgi:hypothetical protein